MSSDVWSPTGDPCVSLGHSCTHLKHVQAFPWSHQWDVCSQCLLRCSVKWGSVSQQSCSCSGGQPGRLHEVCEQLEQMWCPGGCPTAARDTQQKADSPGWLVHTYLQPLVLWIFLPCFPNRV